MKKISNKDLKKKYELWLKLHNHELPDCDFGDINKLNCKFHNSDECKGNRLAEMFPTSHRLAIYDKDGKWELRPSGWELRTEIEGKAANIICLGFLELE
jgi:hypothetical protein